MDDEPHPHLRYIVADDFPLIATMVADMLKGVGVDVVGVAGDGDEALAMCRDLTPDGLVLDFRMPRLDGLQVVRVIRADADLANVFVVLMTSDAEPELRSAAIAAGANHFLLKGVDLERLPTLVRAHAALKAGQGACRPSDDAL